MSQVRRQRSGGRREDELATFARGVATLARARRAETGVSVRRFAALHLSKAVIARIEGGDARNTIADLWHYAQAVGTRVSRLIPTEAVPFDNLRAAVEARNARLQVLR